MSRVLDFSDLPKLDSIPFFHRLNEEVEREIAKFSDVLGRVKGAVYFSHWIHEPPYAHDDNRNELRASFLRASIAEFAGIEEALIRDLDELKISKPPLKIRDTTDPLLHIIRELRNLEIHLKSSEVISSKTDAWLPDFESPEILKPIKMTAWYVDNLDVENFMKLRNAKKYDLSDIG